MPTPLLQNARARSATNNLPSPAGRCTDNKAAVLNLNIVIDNIYPVNGNRFILCHPLPIRSRSREYPGYVSHRQIKAIP